MDELRPVRIGIRCSDEGDFRERFAPRYAAEGVFVPGPPIAVEGTEFRLTIVLKDGRPVLSGIARLESATDEPEGMWLRIVKVNAGSVPLAPVLSPVRRGSSAPPESATLPENGQLGELLFADLPAPEEFAAARPIQVKVSPVKLRLRSTPAEGMAPRRDPKK